MITTRNITDILPIIIQNAETFDQLKNDFPSMLADLTTFKENPNCSCRGRVFKFFTEQLETNPTILDKYIVNTEELTVKLQAIDDQRIANNYAGRVFIIPKSEESWKNFSATLPGKMFRMFSLVERENEIVVYFL